MARITFPDGRWIELRPMYVDDELAVEELGRSGEELEVARAALVAATDALTGKTGDELKAALEVLTTRVEEFQRIYYDMLRRARDRMAAACTATSWGGSFGERIQSSEIQQIIADWRTLTQDDAIPPQSGTSS